MKCKEFSIEHLLFADDAELMAESELELQHILNVLAEIGVEKTEVLIVQPRDTSCHEPYWMQAEADGTNKKVSTILVYVKPLEVVSELKYVGRTENKCSDSFDEIRIRRQRAGQAYAKQAENFFENVRPKLNTRYRAFVSIVISNMLYMEYTVIWGSMFGQSTVPDIVTDAWPKSSYAQVVKSFARYGVAVDTMAIMVSFCRLRYVGHIERGDDVNLTKIILHTELGQRVRPVGKSEQSFRSSLKNKWMSLELAGQVFG
jgi:hypothetical protein